MNPFLLPEKDRLLSWRELRNLIQAASDLEKYNLLVKWWSRAPICAYSIDLHDCTHWPTPWELLNENMFCTSAIAFMMAHTLALTGFDKSRIKLVYVRGNSDERLVVVIDDVVTLNYSYGELFEWSSVQEEVEVLATYVLNNDKFITLP
jgi:hypothetical protein